MMIKIFKKINKFLFGEPTEIEYVEAALKRYNDKLNELDDICEEKNGCCPQCLFGSEYTMLCEKIERVEKWLEILKKRKIKFKKENTK